MAMMVSGEQVQASSSNDSDGDGEEPTCPLCCDEMDVYDRHFRPCACGYQICGFCYHHRAPPIHPSPHLRSPLICVSLMVLTQ
jgi:hypothetical protein